MPQAKRAQFFFSFFLTLTFLVLGCSTPNEKTSLNPATGSHLAGWLPAAHSQAAAADLTSCKSCHGQDLAGGISRVSCTSCHLGGPTSVHPSDWAPVYTTHGTYVTANTTAKCANQYCHGLGLTGVADSGPSCTSCHLGGITSGHPADWVPVYSTHGPYVDASGTGACATQSCHGPQLTGVTGSGPSCTACHLGSPTSVHPTDWVPVYSTHDPYVAANGTGACSNQYCHGPQLTGVSMSGPSCTSCHMGGPTSIHPAEWQGDVCYNHGPYAYNNGTAGCSNIYCHGADLGGIADSGPSCTKCHSPIPSSGQCNYCHGIPPNGTVYPNIAGSHAVHMQLRGVQCATCHNRPCDQHANGTVDVVFDPAYSAETGTASFTNASGAVCTNVSCHGGPRTQNIRTTSTSSTEVTSATTWTSDPSKTPDWYSGSISLNDTAQCFSCHIYGDTLYNGYFSGQHYFHVMEQGVACISCHDTLKLTNLSFHFPDLITHMVSSVTASASTNSWLNFNGTTCTSQSCHSDTRSWW